MSDLEPNELQRVFDFLELKRGEALACWLCGHNDWSARKVRRAESGEPGPEVWMLYVQLICTNCKVVVDFPNSILSGP